MRYGIIFTKEEIEHIKNNYEGLTNGWELYCGENCEKCTQNKVCIKIINKINNCIKSQETLKQQLENTTNRILNEIKNK